MLSKVVESVPVSLERTPAPPSDEGGSDATYRTNHSRVASDHFLGNTSKMRWRHDHFNQTGQCQVLSPGFVRTQNFGPSARGGEAVAIDDQHVRNRGN